MTIIATLFDGRTISEATNTVTVPIGGGSISMTITFPELKTIDKVLTIQVEDTDPPTDINGAVGHHKNINGNVVGFTVSNVATGTTLSAQGAALGY